MLTPLSPELASRSRNSSVPHAGDTGAKLTQQMPQLQQWTDTPVRHLDQTRCRNAAPCNRGVPPRECSRPKASLVAVGPLMSCSHFLCRILPCGLANAPRQGRIRRWWAGAGARKTCTIRTAFLIRVRQARVELLRRYANTCQFTCI